MLFLPSLRGALCWIINNVAEAAQWSPVQGLRAAEIHRVPVKHAAVKVIAATVRLAVILVLRDSIRADLGAVT